MPVTDPSTDELTLGDLVEFAMTTLDPPFPLARWSEHPTVHIRVKPSGVLLVGLANRPTRFEAVLSPRVYIGFDRDDANADVTTVCLQGDNPDRWHEALVRGVVGPTAWRHAQALFATGGGDRTISLSAAEAAALTRRWSQLAVGTAETGMPVRQAAAAADASLVRPTDPSHPSLPPA